MHTVANAADTGRPPVAPKSDPRAVKIFARTLFKDMVANGLSHDQIIALATQLLAQVTEDLRDRPKSTF